MFVVIVAASAATLFGEEEKAISAEFSAKVMSKSIDDNGIPLYGGANIDTEVTLSGGSFYASFRYVRGLDGARSPLEYQSQLESYFGWEGEISKNLTLDVGVAYYDYAPFLKDKNANVPSVYAELKSSREGIQPFVSVESYQPSSSAYFEGGTRVLAGVRYSGAIKDVSLEHSLTGVYEDGAFGYSKAWVGIYSVDFVWGKGARTIILPSLSVYYPFSKKDGQKTEFVVGIGVAW